MVAVAPSHGIIGILTVGEIRRRLAAGTLAPDFVCLRSDATGDVASQWRPLGTVFGVDPVTEAAAEVGSEVRPHLPTTQPSAAGRSRPGPRSLSRVELERRVENGFLMFGQGLCVIAALLLVWRVVTSLYAVDTVASLAGFRPADAALLRLQIAFEGLCGLGFLLAVFVTFRRVRRMLGRDPDPPAQPPGV